MYKYLQLTFILFLFSSPFISAQDQRLRIINAVNLPENTFIYLDGKNLWKKGYKSGQKTGKKKIDIGTHVLEAKNSMCENNLSTEIKIEDNNSVNVVYVYVEERKDKNGKVLERSLKHAQFPPRKKGLKSTVRFISMSNISPLNLKVDGEMINLERGKVYNFSGGKSKHIKVPRLIKIEYEDIEESVVASELEPVGAFVLDDHKTGKIIVIDFYDFEEGRTSYKEIKEDE